MKKKREIICAKRLLSIIITKLNKTAKETSDVLFVENGTRPRAERTATTKPSSLDFGSNVRSVCILQLNRLRVFENQKRRSSKMKSDAARAQWDMTQAKPTQKPQSRMKRTCHLRFAMAGTMSGVSQLGVMCEVRAQHVAIAISVLANTQFFGQNGIFSARRSRARALLNWVLYLLTLPIARQFAVTTANRKKNVAQCCCCRLWNQSASVGRSIVCARLCLCVQTPLRRAPANVIQMNYFKWTAETHNGAPKRAQAQQPNEMSMDTKKQLEKKNN